MTGPTPLDNLGDPPGTDIGLCDQQPADMSEDRLSDRLRDLEDSLAFSLMAMERQGLDVPDHLRAAIIRYGQLWDESWTR